MRLGQHVYIEGGHVGPLCEVRKDICWVWTVFGLREFAPEKIRPATKEDIAYARRERLFVARSRAKNKPALSSADVAHITHLCRTALAEPNGLRLPYENPEAAVAAQDTIYRCRRQMAFAAGSISPLFRVSTRIKHEDGRWFLLLRAKPKAQQSP